MIDELPALLASVLDVLVDIEWAGDQSFYQCPSCKRAKMAGHETWCKLASVLAQIERMKTP